MDWTAVLPADCPEDLLTRVLQGAFAQGWTVEESRGGEQTVLTIHGARDAGELGAILPAEVDVDVLPLLTREQYVRMRRRRAFMSWMVRGLGLLVAVTVLVPILGFLKPPRVSVGVPDEIRVAAVGELTENSARLVRFRGHPVLVVHLDGDQYFGLSAACSYAEECQLEWNRDRRQVVCPCHGDAFDVYGNVLHGPASIPLRRYVVEPIDNELFLATEG